MKIRKITEKDIPLCREWYNRYIAGSAATLETEQLSAEEFRLRVYSVCEKYPWIVAEEDGILRGYAYLSQFIPRDASDRSADISVYLDPDARGKGIGTCLMKELLAIARREGYRSLISIVSSDNTASVRMHEALGFERSGEFRNFGYKFGRWVSVTCFTIALEQPDAVPLTAFSGRRRAGE